MSALSHHVDARLTTEAAGRHVQEVVCTCRAVLWPSVRHVPVQTLAVQRMA